MTAAALRAALAGTLPFRMRTAVGKTIDVPHRDHAILTPSGRVCVVVKDDDSFEVIDTMLVVSLEMLSGAPLPNA